MSVAARSIRIARGKEKHSIHWRLKHKKTSFFGEAAVKYQQSCPPKLLISWSLLSVAR